MKYNILICDDDIDIVNAISILLEQDGYNTIKVTGGDKLLKIINEQDDIHLIILDIMMPKRDGISTLLEVRRNYNIPVIMLSAKSEYTDKIIGLNYGADDYITKPYNPIELVARVKSQIRRYTNLGSISISDDVIKVGTLELNSKEKWTKVDGDFINLTSIEFQILELLIKNAGRVFSIDEIYERVWKEEAYNVNNTVSVHIRRIREKIEIEPNRPRYLKVVWGIGYKIEK